MRVLGYGLAYLAQRGLRWWKGYIQPVDQRIAQATKVNNFDSSPSRWDSRGRDAIAQGSTHLSLPHLTLIDIFCLCFEMRTLLNGGFRYA